MACIGCGRLVPDVEGPTHRYLESSPGCWAAYTTIPFGGMAGPAELPHSAMTVDAYAVQHPGRPGSSSTPSVWIHLAALHLVLERGWSADRLISIRRVVADANDGWPWLTPPASMGGIGAIDVTSAAAADVPDVVRTWVEAAYAAWADHHGAIRALTTRLFG
ncbi:MAG: DUF5946 family protein [Chloroflexota bacterium]